MSRPPVNDTSFATHRHTFSNGSPASPSSPLPLPPLLPGSDDDSSPSGSSVVTPHNGSPAGSVRIASDHSVLSSLAQMPTPTLGSSLENSERRASFPLLSPHHPLRKKLYASLDGDVASPPTTPKGHPLESELRSFPFSKVSLSSIPLWLVVDFD